MFKDLLLLTINNIITYNKSKFSFKNSKKVDVTINSLKLLSKNTSQPTFFYILSYAFFYTEILKNTNLNKLYIDLPKFINYITMINLPIYTSEDNNVSIELHRIWNTLHNLCINDMPRTLQKAVSLYNIKIKKNTFFTHSNNYITFFKIAHYLNNNIIYYPKIHGYIELFLYMPILKRKARIYNINNYIGLPGLDSYYYQYYGKECKEDRLKKFLNEIPIVSSMVDIFKKSNLLGSLYALQFLQRKLEKNV